MIAVELVVGGEAAAEVGAAVSTPPWLKAATPFGVPTPVGPSYPTAPLHIVEAPQLPFEPLVTSCRLAGESVW